MFVTYEMIAEMAARYGPPSTHTFDIPTPADQIEFIRSTQKQGRNHDVTIYAIQNDMVVVTAKHFYPPELYRAPSGGLNPNECFEDGIAREMAEEIGCEVELERFLLQTQVRFFESGDDREEHTPSSEQVPQPPLSRGDWLNRSNTDSGRFADGEPSSAPLDSINDSGRQTFRSAPRVGAPEAVINWRSFVFLARVVSGDFKFTDTEEIREVRLANWSEFDLFSEIMRSSENAGLHYRAKLHEAVIGEL